MKNSNNKIEKKGKGHMGCVSRAAAAFLMLVLGLNMSAQDKILLLDGTEISARVSEINNSVVSYYTFDNQTGPIHLISKSEVFMVTYENGSKEIFKQDGIQQVSIPATTERPSPTSTFVPPVRTKFDGPRFGVTLITPGTITQGLEYKGKHPTLTQFGWQFETRLFSMEGGPTGVLEFVPLIAGLEQGMFLPSASLLVGLRGGGKNALEFGLGPNLSQTGFGMVFAVGTSITSGYINFPINIAYVPSVSSKSTTWDAQSGNTVTKTIETGHRITLTVGFNLRKK